jgi:squalene cyclase
MSLACSVLIGVAFQGFLADSPEVRALAYLAREVPRWHRENQCYSCHNNGDATRALLIAMRRSYPVPGDFLKEAAAWLARPEKWDENKGEPGFNDKSLERIQFAAALVAALDTGAIKDRAVLRKAAECLTQSQRPDGSWQIGVAGSIGSPVTYGATLATAQAMRLLESADAKRYQSAIGRASQWIMKIPARNVVDAAACLMALDGKSTVDARDKQLQCIKLIRTAEAKGGGWGPYVNSVPEPFDTALVVLALSHREDKSGARDMATRGRAFLVSNQQPDGSWVETTRPAGARSYAQRVSTTAWATIALIDTKPVGKLR